MVVNLRASTAEFTKGLNKASGIANSFAKSVKSAFSGLTGLGTAVSAAGIGALVKQQFEAIDATGNLAERLGIATEALVGLQHAANLADVSAEGFEKGMGLMSTKLGEAVSGSKSAQQAFSNIGLNFKELSNIPLDQAFLRIADAIGGMQNANEKAAAAAYIFGAKNKEILLILNKGSTTIKAAMEDARALGLTFTEIDASKIEEADISMKRMGAAVSAAGRQLAVELAPAIQFTAEAVANFVKWIKSNGEAIKAWGQTIVEAAKFVGGIILAVKAYQAVVWLAVKAQKAWAIAQAITLSLSGPKGWIMLAAGAAAAATAIWGIEKAFRGVSAAASNAGASMTKSTDTVQIAAARAKLDRLKGKRDEAQEDAKTKGNLGGVKGWALHNVATYNLAIAKEEEFIKKLEANKAKVDAMKSKGGIDFSISGIAKQIPFVDSVIKGLVSTMDILKKSFDLHNEIQDFNDELKKGIATVGMSGDQIKLWELEQKGIPPAVLQATAALMKQKSATEDAAKIFNDTRTPLEKFQKELARLEELKAGGFLSKDTFARASDELFKRTSGELGADESALPTKIELPQAALAGSSEAISAVNRFQSQGVAMDPQNRIATLAKQQAETQKLMLTKLEQIYEASRGGGQVVKF